MAEVCVHLEDIRAVPTKGASKIEEGTCRKCGQVRRYETSVDANSNKKSTKVTVIKEGNSMVLHAEELHPETIEKLQLQEVIGKGKRKKSVEVKPDEETPVRLPLPQGINPTLSLTMKAKLNLALGKVQQAICSLERSDALWVIQQARSAITGDGLEAILESVAFRFGYKVEELTGSSREAELVIARHAAIYIAVEQNCHTLYQIGRVFGGRTPATVLHACNHVKAEIKTSPALAGEIEQIRLAIREQIGF